MLNVFGRVVVVALVVVLALVLKLELSLNLEPPLVFVFCLVLVLVLVLSPLRKLELDLVVGRLFGANVENVVVGRFLDGTDGTVGIANASSLATSLSL